MKRYEFEERLAQNLKEKPLYILGIDGPCTSGKSTYAQILAERFHAQIIHMDDFFLRPDQRNEQRNSEIGGNFDRERFIEEVKIPLQEEKNVSYRLFSCQKMDFCGVKEIECRGLIIVEGSYAHHPDLVSLYDETLFLNIDEEEQKQRILKRNPDKAEMFFTRWIPKENQYFSTFSVAQHADTLLNDVLSQ